MGLRPAVVRPDSGKSREVVGQNAFLMLLPMSVKKFEILLLVDNDFVALAAFFLVVVTTSLVAAGVGVGVGVGAGVGVGVAGPGLASESARVPGLASV